MDGKRSYHSSLKASVRPGVTSVSTKVVRTPSELARERLWVAVCIIFAATLVCLIMFRRYTRYIHQRRYEDHVSAKEKR